MFSHLMRLASVCVVILAANPVHADPTQFKLKDLRGGDILIKIGEGTTIAKTITRGQKFFKFKNPEFTHAGIMYDNRYMIEAIEAGVVANDISLQNKDYGYFVFRCKDPHLTDGAKEFAKILYDLHAKKQTLKYSVVAACKSVMKKAKDPKSPQVMEKEVDDLLKGGKGKFFCSQVVVFVYQFTAEQNYIKAKNVFSLSDASVPPGKLVELLEDNKAYFEEVGYLLPGER